MSTIIAELSAAAGAGACIHTNSWHHKTGSPPRYTQEAADVDAFTFAHEDHVVLGSVGNRGEEQGPPSTAKNAISVAAASVDATGEHFGDGVAVPPRQTPQAGRDGAGLPIRSAQRGTGCDTVEEECGSSYATPRAAGLAALVRQYFTEGWYPAWPAGAGERHDPVGSADQGDAGQRGETPRVRPGPAMAIGRVRLGAAPPGPGAGVRRRGRGRSPSGISATRRADDRRGAPSSGPGAGRVGGAEGDAGVERSAARGGGGSRDHPGEQAVPSRDGPRRRRAHGRQHRP